MQPPQSAGALTTIVLSLPTQSRGLRLANAAINVLLLLAAVDFVAYPFFDAAQDVVFTRIGAVYPDGVKITVRHPLVEEESQSLHIIWREAKGGFQNWTTGPELKLIEENDWVDTVQLKGLWPKTKYECTKAILTSLRLGTINLPQIDYLGTTERCLNILRILYHSVLSPTHS